MLVSRPDCSMYGVRSCQASEEQNLPTLSSDQDMTASGGFPARIAARTFSSFSPMPVRTSTVIHGYSCSNMSNTTDIFLYSAPANGTQIETVAGACDTSGPVSIGGGAP